MHSTLSTVSLEELGALRARGPGVVSFLQGQLSNDLARLSPERSLLAGYHNPQGRVIALLRLLQLAPDDLLAVLPRELVASVAARLSRFILRAKVQLADESQQWRISGLLRGGANSLRGGATLATDSEAALPAIENQAARIATGSVVRLVGEPARWVLVDPMSQPASPGAVPAADPLIWRRLALAAGEPQVYASTSEEFIAQMLNLDCLGAIAFEKGCYTGQEVIARAHYRGRVKRRMQRFVTSSLQRLRPADAGTLSDGRTFKVVDAAQLPDGRCEFLAVTQLTLAPAAAEGRPTAGRDGTAALEAEQLELPYPLPE
jgi:folate-binding protein YgfZ